MITICLHGSLKRDFGSRFCLHAHTAADALNGLFSQINGLREKIQAGTFLVRLNNKIQTEQTLDNFRLPDTSATIHIVPRTAGAGRMGQMIAGVALIALAFSNPLGLATGHALLSGMMTGGIGLVLGGVAQMLAKPPKLDSNTQGQKASRNTAFSNLDNAAAQGQPVPLAYGLVYCGSRVISQGVESRRISQDTTKNAANNGFLISVPLGSATTSSNTSSTPIATHVALAISKTFTAGTAAIAPNGQPYATDFAHDSVRNRNYVARFQAA